MAIASKPKPTAKHHQKRQAAHHRRTKHYVKSYWPYIPMLLVVVSGFYINTFLNRSAVLGVSYDVSPTSLVTATNDARGTSREPLALSTELANAAQAKADDMVSNNYWSHQSPDGRSPWDFINASGYQYVASAENLAFGFSSAADVTKAWLQSPEHKRNMLNEDYRTVGFGVAQSSDYLHQGPQTIVVAMYATPGVGEQSAPVIPLDQQPVSRVSTVLGSASAGLFIGIVGTLSLLYVVGRHSIGWRKLVNRGELFVIQHPVFDISLVTIAALAVIASQTAGYIS